MLVGAAVLAWVAVLPVAPQPASRAAMQATASADLTGYSQEGRPALGSLWHG
jgi:hypothetical protein